MPEDVESELARRTALANVIQSRRRDIVNRWLAAVRTNVGARSLDSTEIRDAMPDYLGALARVLRSRDVQSSVEMGGNAAWIPVAQEHAVTRVRQGFDIEQLVHEFILLRRVLFDVARENGLGSDREARLLADMIEAGIATSLKSYVDSRDYAARRAEAEHIGFVTHELKTPLTAAHVVTQSLGAELRLNDSQQKQFDLLARSLERLRDLVDSVLLAERFEANQVEAHAVAVTLGELLPEPIDAARAIAGGKGIELEASYEPRLLVYVDPKLTISVINNLLDNAIKYTDEGAVELTCVETDAAVEVHVRDNCSGLSTEELRTIFEPFRRGHHPKKPGAGLGLAIAKRAVLAQGGQIGAESPKERGCHFWFTLAKAAH